MSFNSYRHSPGPRTQGDALGSLNHTTGRGQGGYTFSYSGSALAQNTKFSRNVIGLQAGSFQGAPLSSKVQPATFAKFAVPVRASAQA